MKTAQRSFGTFLFILGAAAGGCSVGGGLTSPDGTDDAITVDEGAILEQVAHQRYRTTLSPVNNTAYVSALDSTKSIDVFVSPNALDAYDVIAPEITNTHGDVPVGTVIVRAVEDASGTVQKLTLMYKGPVGYNPSVGDFWYGVTDPEGVPLKNDAGMPQLGKISTCFGCHQERMSDGWLFGVPRGNRAPGTTPTTPAPTTPAPTTPAPTTPAPTTPTVDTQPPQFGGAATVVGQQNKCTLTWASATDDVTPPTGIVYQAFVQHRNGWDFSNPDASSAPGALTLDLTFMHTQQTSVQIIVRARDGAGNHDTNKHAVTCQLQ